MESILINVYVFVVMFGVLTAIVVLLAFILFCCLEEVNRRRNKTRERYLKEVETFIVATSTLAGATTGTEER